MSSASSDVRSGRRARRPIVALGAGLGALLTGHAGLAADTSGRDVRFGAYDPYGTFAYDARIGIEHVFIPWQDVNLASLQTVDRYASERGRNLLITVEPWSWSPNKLLSPSEMHAGVVTGSFDGLIRAVCQAAGGLKSSVTLRWAHEMDITNKRYPWSHWSPEQYVRAYRHFVDVCRSTAANLKFMWSPRGETNLRDYYPGSEYVDNIGLTLFGYQNYEVGVYGRSLSLAERLMPSYRLVTDYDKDVYISEFGCQGDDAYVRRCIDEAKSAAAQFPKISGFVYFNEVESFAWPGSYGYPDWRIMSRLAARTEK